MNIENPQIKIPETGGITPEDIKKETDSKFKDINYILLSVVIILLVMVATLIIDSFHFNSVIYREYSQKLNIQKEFEENNKIMKEEIINYQKDLIEQQGIIIEELKKIKIKSDAIKNKEESKK
jgi:uncharacterized ion transporter superfamily protein YfcC